MNSTITSDNLDNDYKKVVLGLHQSPPPENGVVNIMMCHHPPDWWLDPVSVADGIETHCRVELFGHKHSQRLKRIDNTVVLSAGAVQPDKREPDWEPRYNWLGLSVSGTGGDRALIVRAYPRVWEKSKSYFVPDRNACNGEDHREESLTLQDWKPVVESSSPRKSVSGDSEPAVEQPAILDPATAKEEKQMDRARVLTYRFFDLPHVTRIDIACDLKLYMDDDEGLQDYELYDRLFERATQQNLLAKLWDQVEQEHADGKYEINPFE